jgi:hypothetical protein
MLSRNIKFLVTAASPDYKNILKNYKILQNKIKEKIKK